TTGNKITQMLVVRVLPKEFSKGPAMQHETSVAFDIASQLHRLVQLGVPALAGYSADDFISMGKSLSGSQHDLLVVPASRAVPSVPDAVHVRVVKPGFGVGDMDELVQCVPMECVSIADKPLYVIGAIVRGDDMRDWSPEEALLEITNRGRRPLTVSEGISWLLQQPNALASNKCFMYIASRILMR